MFDVANMGSHTPNAWSPVTVTVSGDSSSTLSRIP
jgi:hypothetical protein